MNLAFWRKPNNAGTSDVEETRDVGVGEAWSTGGAATRAMAVDRVLGLAPVYASVRLISEQVASLPFKAFQEAGDTRTPVPVPPLFKSPSATVRPFAWKQQCLASLLLRGNAYGYITAWVGNTPKTIEWMRPDLVTVDESTSMPTYYYNGQRVDPSRIVHIPGLSLPGTVVGVSPLTAFRTLFETGLEAQDFTHEWFQNGGPASPGSTLKNTAKTMTNEQAQDVKSRARSSIRNGELLVLGSDWDYTSLGVSGEDAAFLQTIKMNATQIASVYGIPPEMIGGDTGTSLTYSTVEMNTLNFVMFTLRPWLVRLEEAFSVFMPTDQSVRFNVNALLRSDAKTRTEVYEMSIRNKILTVDEVRALEDRGPLPAEDSKSWQDVGLPSLVAAGIVSKAWAAEKVGAPTDGLPTVAVSELDAAAANEAEAAKAAATTGAGA